MQDVVVGGNVRTTYRGTVMLNAVPADVAPAAPADRAPAADTSPARQGHR
jgi:hypothetical protein